MNGNASFVIRIVLALGLAAYALGLTDGGGGSKPAPSGPYEGQMTSLHDVSRSMADMDKAVMSEAFSTGGDMLAADKKGLVDTTEVAQDFVFGILSFSYNGVGQPVEKYPAVADAIEAELRKVYGDEITSLSPSQKDEIVRTLKEIAKAVR
jgi:hypothetical protein